MPRKKMFALDNKGDATNVSKYSERLKGASETRVSEIQSAQGFRHSYIVEILQAPGSVNSSDGTLIKAHGTTKLEWGEYYPTTTELYPGFGVCAPTEWDATDPSNASCVNGYILSDPPQNPEFDRGEGFVIWNPLCIALTVGQKVVAVKTPSGFIAVAKCGLPDGIHFTATCNAAFTTSDTDVACTFSSCSYTDVFGITTGSVITLKNPGIFSAAAGKIVLGTTTNDELHMINVEC